MVFLLWVAPLGQAEGRIQKCAVARFSTPWRSPGQSLSISAHHQHGIPLSLFAISSVIAQTSSTDRCVTAPEFSLSQRLGPKSHHILIAI